ncbi:MAG: response regulator [Pseudomonadota bacterium]
MNIQGLNGLEICKTLRANKKYKHIPIIFVSALASAQEILAGECAGGDDYLTKPFNQSSLKKAITTILK